MLPLPGHWYFKLENISIHTIKSPNRNKVFLDLNSLQGFYTLIGNESDKIDDCNMDQAKLNQSAFWVEPYYDQFIIFVEQLIVCQSKTDINFALKSLGFLLFHGGAMRLHSYRSHTALLANTSPVYINACNHFSTLLLRLVSSTPFGFIY